MALRCFLLAACLAALPLRAPAAPAPDFAPLERWIQASKDAVGLPSATAIVVVRDGRILHQAYLGYADIGRRVPADAGTPFYIASATKPLFALNVLVQEAQGRLDTSTSLRSMFPQAPFPGIDANAITARDLLVHASGLENEPLTWATAYSGLHDARSREALVAASRPDPESAHGRFRYGNVGYNIASAWTERVLGEPWQQQVQHTVLGPLRMRHSSAYASRVARRGRSPALPYSLASPDAPLYLRKVDETMHAAGGLYATAPDLARLLLAELGGGKVDGRQRFPSQLIARSQRDEVAVDDRYQDFVRTGYAWGWYSGPYKQQRLLHHFGGFAGTHAHLSFMPGAGIGLVVLNNEDMMAPRLSSLVADYVYGTLLGDVGTPARVEARFQAMDAEMASLRASLPARRATLAARPWRLSLPRAAYAGRYRDALVGDVVVALTPDEQLQLAWGRVASRATAVDAPEQVRVEFVPNAGQVVAFELREGRAVALSFAGMRFARVE